METKKLEQKDLNSIMELRSKYAETTNTIGMIATDEYSLNKQLELITSEKTKFFNELETLRKEEQTLMESLKEKYGDGQINIEEGTFTPVS